MGLRAMVEVGEGVHRWNVDTDEHHDDEVRSIRAQLEKLEEDIERYGGNNPKRQKTSKVKENLRALRNQRQAQITRMKQRMKEEGHRIRLRILLDFLPERIDRLETEKYYFASGSNANEQFVLYLENKIEP